MVGVGVGVGVAVVVGVGVGVGVAVVVAVGVVVGVVVAVVVAVAVGVAVGVVLMDLTDNLLRSVLNVQARNDTDATLQAFAREVMQLRSDLATLRQAFVPVVSTLSKPLREMTMDFNDLCLKHKIAAAVVFPVGKPDGELLLHVAGETRAATLVKGMIDRNAI